MTSGRSLWEISMLEREAHSVNIRQCTLLSRWHGATAKHGNNYDFVNRSKYEHFILHISLVLCLCKRILIQHSTNFALVGSSGYRLFRFIFFEIIFIILVDIYFPECWTRCIFCHIVGNSRKVRFYCKKTNMNHESLNKIRNQNTDGCVTFTSSSFNLI